MNTFQIQNMQAVLIVEKGGGEGSSRGRSSRRLDRWVFSMAPAFFVRASSIRSPRVANNGADGTSATAPLPPAVESV